ncbi:uncharacterized protein lratb.1 [Corythoichthys intestinalis]|uniref:uncharacterized protein lratb.1 n=1 Tax=Corythoichthys intestinalis TaxID=161448 RepID=UPI0025A5AE22|nr:uncharacterized protein lratb.1 [Corythoichthys intestinalis]
MFACLLLLRPERTLKHVMRSRVSSWTNNRRSKHTRAVRIGCASGFWGDTATSVPQLIHGGKLDFLVFDYLSEITMSLLTAAKTKAPNLGYAPDFVQAALAPSIHDIHKKGVRVVSNAGGVNPLACAAAIREVVQKAGLDLKVAVVTGDDLMAQRSRLTEVKTADGARALPRTLHSMNAYLGAGPIRRCLDLGADIVVTGRCVDSALALGPLTHAFGWGEDDLDLLAAGSLAGHLIECGAQSTGGIFTDWHLVPNWDNIGFPVVECCSDGSFVLSKPPKTGGLVSFGTAAEQLVYEIGDPRRYVLPDVICDFSHVLIQEVPGVEGGAVRVSGAKGLAPPRDYKVCATYMDGFRATAVCPLGGPRAAEKARRTAESIIKRTRRIFKHLHLEDFTDINIQVLGAEDTYGAHGANKDAREAVLWLAVCHKDKKALEVFSREIAPAGTGMAPGLCGIVGGRPRVSPILKPLFFYQPKSQLQIHIHLDGHLVESFSEAEPESPEEEATPTWDGEEVDAELPTGPHCYRLEELAYARSGDKGDSANIGVIARDARIFPYLKKHLTSSAVEDYLVHIFPSGLRGAVTRYTLPGINGLNFVLKNSLGGGGVASLRSDPQGKALAQMLLDLELRGLPDLAPLLG